MRGKRRAIAGALRVRERERSKSEGESDGAAKRKRGVLSFLDVQSIVASTRHGARDSAAEARPGKTSGILADSTGTETR